MVQQLRHKRQALRVAGGWARAELRVEHRLPQQRSCLRVLWRSVCPANSRVLPTPVAIGCCCCGGRFPGQRQASLAAVAAEAAAAAAGGRVVKALHQVASSALCTVLAVWRLAVLLPSLRLSLRLLLPFYSARRVHVLLLVVLLLLVLLQPFKLLLLLQQQWRRLRWLHAAARWLHSLLGAGWLHHAAKHPT